MVRFTEKVFMGKVVQKTILVRREVLNHIEDMVLYGLKRAFIVSHAFAGKR